MVKAGTLGGSGTIGGKITIGTGRSTGAYLNPSVGLKQPVTLTIQNKVTFKADATYTCRLSTRTGSADEVTASGVTIESSAQFDFHSIGNRKLAAGASFTVINNTSADPISGPFSNLADGSTITAGNNTFLVSYSGGDGNDLTLTVA